MLLKYLLQFILWSTSKAFATFQLTLCCSSISLQILIEAHRTVWKFRLSSKVVSNIHWQLTKLTVRLHWSANNREQLYSNVADYIHSPQKGKSFSRSTSIGLEKIRINSVLLSEEVNLVFLMHSIISSLEILVRNFLPGRYLVLTLHLALRWHFRVSSPLAVRLHDLKWIP